MTKDECRNCPYVAYDEIDPDRWFCEMNDDEDIENIDTCVEDY